MAEPIVQINAGAIRGRAEGGVASYLGIPYAAPPFGVDRLREPQPVAPWSGVRDALEPGPTPPKSEYPAAARALFPEPVVPGEGCLNLNVWAPEAEGSHPVLVWIYGGSFQMGSNAVPEYDGTAFARDGVVCVTPNYRLGVEGFLELNGAPSNRALRDLVAALRWVHTNIAVFGGDPSRVTIAGESAGALLSASLLAVPEAEGLFSAVALQSTPFETVLTPAQAAKVTDRVASTLGVEPTREAFVALPAAQLVEAGDALVSEVQGHPDRWGALAVVGRPLAPVVDGSFLTADPTTALLKADRIPVLIGTNRDEYRLFLPLVHPGQLDESELEQAAAPYGLDRAGVEAYGAAAPDLTPWDRLAALIGDWRYRIPAIRAAEARTGCVAGTWMWRFDGVARADNGGLGSCHATDVPFIFATADNPLLHPRIGDAPSADTVRAVHGTWVRFVLEHDPGWATYSTERRTTAIIDRAVEPVDDPASAERRAWLAGDHATADQASVDGQLAAEDLPPNAEAAPMGPHP